MLSLKALQPGLRTFFLYLIPPGKETVILCFCLFFILLTGNSSFADGTYEVAQRDKSFLKLKSGLVVDTGLNLMWAGSDNGVKISFKEAEEYLKTLALGGFNDWRFPTIQELETLMVYDPPNSTSPGKGCTGNYLIHHFFSLTCCCPWALQDNGTRPASYPFIKSIATGSMWHHKSGRLGNRILPVRDIKK